MTRSFRASLVRFLPWGMVVVLALLASGTQVVAQNLLAVTGAGLEEPIDAAPADRVRSVLSPDRARAKPAPEPGRFLAGEPGVALFPEGIEWGAGAVDVAQYVEESARTILPPADGRGIAEA